MIEQLLQSVRFAILLVSIHLLLLVEPSQAQWIRTNGPEGGTISDIEKIGNYLAVVTVYGESYFSNDGGNNWTERTGLPGSFAPRLAVRGNELFAATQAGVFVTSNFGVNWNQLTQGIGNIYLRGIAVKDGIVFAFSDEYTIGNVYKLNDATQTWQLVGPYTTTFQSVYNAHVKDDYLFLSVFNGVLRSSDEGVTWEDVSSGLPIGGVYGFSSLQDQLFVGTSNGLYLSEDDGSSWRNVGLEGYRVWTVDVIAGTLYAGTSGFGVYRSADLGVSWQNIGLEDKWVYDLKETDGFLFAGTNFVGMFRSQVNNISWELINKDLNGMPVSSFSNMGQDLIAGVYGGLFITSDMGETWSDKGQYFPPTDPVTELRGSHLIYDVASDQQNNIIYAGSISAIYKSSDFGETWSIQGQPTITSGRMEALFVSEIDPDNTKVMAGKGTGIDPIGLFTSTDAGQNWTFNNLGYQNVYILDIKRKGSLLFAAAGYSTNGGVFRSSDNGLTWTKLAGGLPFDITVEALFVSNQGDIFAACDGGLYKSFDNGDSWTQVWVNAEVTGLASDLQGILYASSASFAYKGIYKSTDNGNTWQPFNEGLAKLPDIVFSITYKNGWLYAGVDRLGVWKRLVDPNVSIDDKKEVSRGLRLGQNAPNPFKTTTTIEYSIPEAALVSLKVYNYFGNEIATLVNERKSAGTHFANWDAQGFPAGTYFYVIQAGSFTERKKMMVVRL